jgi:palmitoyltransferase
MQVVLHPSIIMPRGVCHWGPILALSIIITLFVTGLYAMTLVYPPWRSFGSMLQLCIYLTWLFLILMNFLKAIWLGPGYVPLKWTPVSTQTWKGWPINY